LFIVYLANFEKIRLTPSQCLFKCVSKYLCWFFTSVLWYVQFRSCIQVLNYSRI